MNKNLIHYLKKIIEIYYRLKSNKLIVLLLRKPINTWILPNFNDHKIIKKNAKIWENENYYKTIDYTETESVYQKQYINYLKKNTDKSDHILDICCNQGRHLKELHHLGYRDLYGVDIMQNAIKILKESNEYIEGGIRAYCDHAQTFLQNSRDLSFDYALTYSATIELMHPNFRIFKNLQRIIRKGFIFVINEWSHSYPRYYRYQIKNNGFYIKYHQKFQEDLTLLHCMKLKN